MWTRRRSMLWRREESDPWGSMTAFFRNRCKIGQNRRKNDPVLLGLRFWRGWRERQCRILTAGGVTGNQRTEPGHTFWMMIATGAQSQLILMIVAEAVAKLLHITDWIKSYACNKGVKHTVIGWKWWNFSPLATEVELKPDAKPKTHWVQCNVCSMALILLQRQEFPQTLLFPLDFLPISSHSPFFTFEQ